MNDGLRYTPELQRPPGHASLRDQLNEANKALAAEREARVAAENDARCMAQFITSRVNSKVWGNDDVIRIVAAVVNALLVSPLGTMAAARSKGIQPSYTVIAQILNTRVIELHAELNAAFESGELDANKLASPEMRELLLSRLLITTDIET